MWRVKLVPPQDCSSDVRLPHDCQQIVSAGGLAGASFFIRYYVDDGVLVEGRFYSDGRRCLHEVQSIASDHFRLLGSRGPNDRPLLSPQNITNFETRLEVLGWILDAEKLTVSMTLRKLEKLRRYLGEWPVSRQTATVREVSGLTSFLLHVSFAMRPWKFFVSQLMAAVGMPQSATFLSGLDNPNRRVMLGPLFHGELDFWRWFVDKELAYRGGHFSSPMYNVIIRPPRLTIFTSVSKSAFGGYCLQVISFVTNCQPKRSLVFCGSSKFVTLLSIFSSCWLSW